MDSPMTIPEKVIVFYCNMFPPDGKRFRKLLRWEVPRLIIASLFMLTFTPLLFILSGFFNPYYIFPATVVLILLYAFLYRYLNQYIYTFRHLRVIVKNYYQWRGTSLLRGTVLLFGVLFILLVVFGLQLLTVIVLTAHLKSATGL